MAGPGLPLKGRPGPYRRLLAPVRLHGQPGQDAVNGAAALRRPPDQHPLSGAGQELLIAPLRSGSPVNTDTGGQ